MNSKSVITCDMEGIIETFSDGAEKIFGYKAEEVVGKKRVSMFSPGEIVLQNVAMWLKEASTKGEYLTETQFVHKDGHKINANIRITPTFANGKENGQTGYCGVTEILEKDVHVPIKFSTKLIKGLAITRLPFISAVIMPALIAGALAALNLSDGSFNSFHFILSIFGVVFLHLGSNVLNDYFDVKDGTDEANNEYFLQYSGGSRAIELGLITLEGTKRLGWLLVAAAASIGAYLAYVTGVKALAIGLAGLFLGYFYTAPPLRLVARRGLGELAISLAFGPLVTLGVYYVLTQELSLAAFMIGLAPGFLTANILLINEFPDAKSDATTGKNHLVVTYGKKKSIGIYFIILLLSFLANIYAYFYISSINGNMVFLGVSIFSLLFGLKLVTDIKKNFASRTLVKSNINTIALSALTGLAMAASIYFFGG
tara:strand:+ start:7823 stop:9103 length:1281 start_codon:yes stop_codon:yes gene_type:complete